MSGAQWFQILVNAPDPRKRIRDIRDGDLAAAIAEFEAMPEPNEFHAEIYVLCVREAVRRWRCGILTVDLVAEEGTADSR
jgi:hypothetical protein